MEMIFISDETKRKLSENPLGVFVETTHREASGKWCLPVSQGVLDRLQANRSYGESIDGLIQRLISTKH